MPKLLTFATPELSTAIWDFAGSETSEWMSYVNWPGPAVTTVTSSIALFLSGDRNDPTPRFLTSEDANIIQQFNALPGLNFLKWWNESEYSLVCNAINKLSADIFLVVDNPVQHELYQGEIDELNWWIPEFTKWFLTNGITPPSPPTAGDSAKSPTAQPPESVISPKTEGRTTTPTTDLTWDGYFVKYLDYVNTNFAPKTAENAQRVHNEFSKVFGSKRLNDFTLQDFESFKKTRKDSGVSNTTVNIDLKTIKAAFNVAVDWEYLPRNPAEKSKSIKVAEKTKAHLTESEFKKVLDAVSEDWLHDIVSFTVLTGLRLGELMNLKWTDFVEEKKTIAIESTAEYRVKAGKRRTIPLNEQALEILKKRSHVSDWIFADKGGKRYSSDYVSRSFKKAIRDAGLSEDLHFHSLRHTYCTWAAGKGVPVHILKQLAGHSSIRVTEVYLGADDESLRQGVEKVKLPEGERGGKVETKEEKKPEKDDQSS